MPDPQTLALIQQAARRWGVERGAYWSAQLTPRTGGEHLSRLINELAEQGWLPAAPDEWGEPSAMTLVRLGRALGREAPSVFMPILTHWLGSRLLQPGLDTVREARIGLIGTSPYVDHSRTRSKVAATRREHEWFLDGEADWVINLQSKCCLALVARLPDGTPGVFEVDTSLAGCCVGAPLDVLGLWGVPARHIRLASVHLSAEKLVVMGEQAHAHLAECYRCARWAVLSLLCGALERLCEHARTYAETRIQGGRRIIEHPPVRQLLDVAQGAVDSFSHLLERFELQPGADYSGAEVRHQARRASDCALQVFGGLGYVCPGLPERCWRDVHQAATLCSGVLC